MEYTPKNSKIQNCLIQSKASALGQDNINKLPGTFHLIQEIFIELQLCAWHVTAIEREVNKQKVKQYTLFQKAHMLILSA